MTNILKIIFFSVFNLLLFSNTISQSYDIFVVDEKGDEIPFVNVEVSYLLHSKKITNQLSTDGSGVLKIDSAWQEVKLKLKHISYQSKHTSVSASNNKVVLYLDNIEIESYVVTGQYSPGSTDKSVHKIRVIDSKRIEAQGAVNLQELMEQEMNVRVSQDQFLGSSMSVQGLSGENVKILIDGVPVIGRLNGSVDLSQINLNNIERVEIIEGPLSVNYGTNALAGTINLITKKNTKKLGVLAEGYYESVGQYNFNASVDFNIKSHSFTISGGRNFFDGYSQFDTTRVQQWKPKEQVFGGLKYSKTINKLTYTLASDYFLEKLVARGEPRKPYLETAFDDYFTTNRFSNSLNLHYKFNERSNFRILGGYNYYNRTNNRFLKDLVNIKYQLVEGNGQQDTSVFDLIFSRGTYSFSSDSSKINFQLGYDINVESNRGKRIEGGEKQIGDYAVFGSLEYKPLKKMVVRPGLRYAYNTLYNSPLIPSLNVKYQWTKHFTSRFSWGRGFRAPSLKELHFLFVDINHNIKGNKELQAENSNNFNLNLGYKRGIKRGVYDFGLSGFYNAINNQISLALVDASSQLYTYTNIGKFYSQGLNFNTGFRYKTYKTNLGFSWIGRYNTEYALDNSLKKFFYTPEISASFGYEVEKWQTVFNLFYKYSGKVLGYLSSEKEGVTQYELGEYNMMDVSVVKYLFKKRLRVTLGAKNMFNVGQVQSNQASTGQSGVHSGGGNQFPVAWGRSYFIKISLNLHK